MISSKIKTISLFLVSILLLGIFCSCGEDPYFKFSRDLEPLTEEQIEACNSAYRDDYFGSYDEYVGSSSEDMREQAERIYYGMKFIQNNVYTPYLGTFSGTIICASALSKDEDHYVLGDLRLEMGTLKKITVYKDGKFVTLSQAYNSGWITDADVQIIANRIEQYHAELEK